MKNPFAALFRARDKPRDEELKIRIKILKKTLLGIVEAITAL